jgi:hypothetical protein
LNKFVRASCRFEAGVKLPELLQNTHRPFSSQEFGHHHKRAQKLAALCVTQRQCFDYSLDRMSQGLPVVLVRRIQKAGGDQCFANGHVGNRYRQDNFTAVATLAVIFLTIAGRAHALSPCPSAFFRHFQTHFG